MNSKTNNYIEAVGRRKTAVARVRITPNSKGAFTVNEKSLTEYFKTPLLVTMAKRSLVTPKMEGVFAISAKVEGGGVKAQAAAISHGLARALVKHDSVLKSPLKKDGLLRRDPRAKERRKFGLKKARKSPQWSKR